MYALSDDTEQDVGLVYFHSPDISSRYCWVQFAFVDSALPELVAAGLNIATNDLMRRYPLRRLYLETFAPERGLPSAATLEATLAEHAYNNGQYRDLYIYVVVGGE